MRLIAKVIRISHVKFHCNGLTTVQDIQDYTSLIFGTQWTLSLCFLQHSIFSVSTRPDWKAEAQFSVSPPGQTGRRRHSFLCLHRARLEVGGTVFSVSTGPDWKAEAQFSLSPSGQAGMRRHSFLSMSDRPSIQLYVTELVNSTLKTN